MSELQTEVRLAASLFPVSGDFPAAEVEACIREALDAERGAQAVLRERVPSACEPEVDSLVAVEVICAIEEALGIDLPATFAPRGGYDDVEACVSDLVAKTRVVWTERVQQTEEQDV
jgi:acyl carrier protein